MQYPASASYRNNQRVSLNAIIDKAQGPSEPASAIVKGKVEDLWDRRVSHHKATTGRDPVYVIVDVSDDAMHSVQLAPMVKRKLGEGFSRDSGNVMQHIATSNGKSNWLFSRAFQAWNPGDKGWLFQALREGARQCASIADATQTILIEHYASQANPRCARVELVWSRSMDHAFVRVVMKDGTLVIHDHWINPEVFLAEDGRFSSADDLTVKSSWSPGDPLPQRWEDLKQQAKDAGPIKDKELDAAWRSFVGKGTPNDLVAYARLKIIRRQTLDRTESDCLLTESQAAERGLQPNEKIVYHHGGTYYANDVVAESSLRRAGDPAFPRLHLQQAQWELDVEAACVRRDLPALIPLLQRTDVRQWFPERHRNLCLGAMNIALGLPLDRQNMALIGALFDNAIDAATATQMQQMLRMRAIGDALNMGDAVDLVNLLSPECVCATGDGGALWLMSACASLNVDGIKCLLGAGAQFTPHGLSIGLNLAIGAGGVELVKLLLKLGASALRPDLLGLSAWQFAQQALRNAQATGGDVNGRQLVAECLCGHAVAEALALQPADRALLESLRAGLDDQALRNKLALAIWRSELEQACASGDADGIRGLFASDVVRATPALAKKAAAAAASMLCHAIDRASVDLVVVESMLSAGVDVNLSVKGGKSPLLAARRLVEACPPDDPARTDRLRVLKLLEGAAAVGADGVSQ